MDLQHAQQGKTKYANESRTPQVEEVRKSGHSHSQVSVEATLFVVIFLYSFSTTAPDVTVEFILQRSQSNYILHLS